MKKIKIVSYVSLPYPLPDDASMKLTSAGEKAVAARVLSGHGSAEHLDATRKVDIVLKQIRKQYGQKIDRPALDQGKWE